jgi:glycosyltransferase involved in cell wall biosynthesis
MKILSVLHGFGLKEGNVSGPFSEVLMKLAEFGNEIHVIAPGPSVKTIEQRIGKGRITLHQLEKPPSPVGKLLYFFKMIAKGIHIKKKYGIDVVHSHIHGMSAFVAMSIARATGTPHTHWHCEDLYKYYRDALLEAGVAHAIKSYLTLVIGMKSADLVITCTDATLECDKKIFGIPTSKFRIIPNSVSLDRFNQDVDASEVNRRYNTKGKKVILFVHRLAPRKGPEYLIRALPKIKEEVPNILCILVGDGPQRKQLEELARELGVYNITIFAGSKPTGEIPQFFSACDVYVMPSEIEGFGRTIAEAMACRRPVVATRVGGVPEVVVDGKTGLLIPPRDPEAIAEATTRLLKDKKLSNKLAENGFKRARELYSLDRVAGMFESVFQELVGK